MKTLLIVSLALLTAGAHAQVARLDVVPGTEARALSADGRTVLAHRFGLVVVGNQLFDADRAVVWTLEGSRTLDPWFEPYGMSADASVICGGQVRLGATAYRYTEAGGREALPSLPGLPPPVYSSSSYDPAIVALAASGDGAVLVGEQRRRAVRWDASGAHELTNWPGQASGRGFESARAASFDGSVIVGRGAGYEACRWTNSGGVSFLGFPTDCVSSLATTVSADGWIVFGRGYRASYTQSVPPVDRAFRWTAATGMTPLDGLQEVLAATPDGRLAVGSTSVQFMFTPDQTPPSRPPRPGQPTEPNKPVTGRWSRINELRLWDARGGVVDLEALARQQGVSLPYNSWNGNDPSYGLYEQVVGVAHRDGLLTVVGTRFFSNPYVGYCAYRLVVPYDPAPLRITASLDGFRGDRTTLPVTVELRKAGSVVQKATVFPEAGGRIVVNAPTAGTYDVSLCAPRFLRRTLRGVSLSGGTADLAAALLNGDVDGNGVVNAADRAKVTLALGTLQGRPGFDPLCDLDGNGVVNAADRALLTLRLGSVGDQ